MSRIACLLGVVVVAGLISGAACNGKGKSQADGGGGTSGGAGAGGTAGTGGAGGAPITSCPAGDPHGQPVACAGQLACQFEAGCTCHGCCYAFYNCVEGRFVQTTFNDTCGQGPPCQDGGAGTMGSGVGGNGGGSAARGGSAGAAGSGGAVGSGGAAGMACPMERPTIGTACTGTSSCNYDDLCRCNNCCYTTYRCTNGRFEFLGANDGCLQITCFHDDHAEAGTAAVCTFGADQTCNDNPRLSSIHGRCTDAGACACGDAGTNPDSGRCL